MTTTDRQPWEVLREAAPILIRAVRFDGELSITAIADLLEAEHQAARGKAKSAGGELMRTAGAILDMRGHTREARVARGVAEMLDAEDRAAQKNAEREAEREKLIEQGSRVVRMEYDQCPPNRYPQEQVIAQAFVDAGWRPAPESDGGEQA